MSIEDKKGFDETYRYHIFEGSTFVKLPGSKYPDKPYKNNLKIDLGTCILNEYLPAQKKALPGRSKGLILLLTIQAYQEGFNGRVVNGKREDGTLFTQRVGTRSWLNNNPGNIGNTDSGANVKYATLEEGILRQEQLIMDMISGKLAAYPLGRMKEIPPTFSKEIAKNEKSYQMSPWLPGYRFLFTGQLDQYVKIYSTGARAGNNYINRIVSYFRANGITITPESKIQDIIK